MTAFQNLVVVDVSLSAVSVCFFYHTVNVSLFALVVTVPFPLVTACQTWERAELFSKNPEWLAYVFLMKARVYTEAGEVEKARASYAQVPRYKQAQYSGLAIYDQASALIEQGKHSEARA